MSQSVEDENSDGENDGQTSILFEDQTDIYGLTISDNFLENLSVSSEASGVSSLPDGYEFTSSDFLSDEDIFGPSVTEISSQINEEWIAALTANTDFDLDLAYSSHELLDLNGNNTIYDTSTSNSLILSHDGLQDISTGSKTADIFIDSGSAANISGESSQVNLYVRESDLKNVQIEGRFEGIEFNLFVDNSEKIPEIELDGHKLLLKGETVQEIDVSDIELVLEGISVNFYSTDGLVSAQTSPPIFNEQEQALVKYTQPEINASASYSDQLLFEDDVEIIQISKSPLGTTPAGESAASIFDGQSDGISDLEYQVESQMESIIDETSLLLETETMFLDPLDVFADEDFL